MAESIASQDKSADKKSRWGCFSISLLPLVTIPLLLTSMFSVSVLDGPKSEHFATTGVFTPGGFIDIQVDFREDSILGYYKGSLTFQPDTTAWPPQSQQVGSEWGRTIRKIGHIYNKPIWLHWIVPVPAKPELAGQTVSVVLTADIEYPTEVGVGRFIGRHSRLSEHLSFQLASLVPSNWDMACARFRYSTWGIVGILLLALGWLFDLLVALALLFPKAFGMELERPAN